jgi:hypothetical protein
MLRVLREHSAHQIADDRWHSLLPDQRRIASHFQLALDDRAFVVLFQRGMAKRQAQ